MGGVLSWAQDYWQGEIFVAVLGLDCAGKSALVHRMQYKDIEEPLPTMGFFVHTLRLNNTLMKVADVAGQDSMRGLWSVMYHRACLLYTSPSPRDLSTSRMPSSA